MKYFVYFDCGLYGASYGILSMDTKEEVNEFIARKMKSFPGSTQKSFTVVLGDKIESQSTQVITKIEI